MRERLLASWGKISARHPYWILLAVFVLSLLSIYNAKHLRLSMRWSDLLPTTDPKVQEYDRIIKEYKSASNSILVVQGNEKDIKRFAENIAPRIARLTKYVERVDYKIDSDFLKRHGLLLTKTKDLKNNVDLFKDLNLVPLLTAINDNFEKTYTGDEKSLSTKKKEQDAVRYLNGLHFWLRTLERYALNGHRNDPQLIHKTLDRFLIGDPYFISQDKNLLILIIEPTFSVVDLNPVVASTDSIQRIIDRALPQFPGVKAGLTGTVPLSRDETVYSMRDMNTTSVLAFTLILLIFILTFRMVATPFLAMINLVFAIMIASGAIAIFIDHLNIMTSMFAAVLMGLGIDFSIHVLALYYELRAKTSSSEEAMAESLRRSGPGILTGGLTTAVAFFTLMVSQTRGIKELGLVLGVGIVTAMVTTFILLPTLMIIRERLLQKLGKKEAKIPHVEFEFLGKVGNALAGRPRTTLALGTLVTLFLLYQAYRIEFDYNYLNMEPKGIPSVTLQDTLIKYMDMSPDMVMVSVNSVEKARAIAEKAREVSTVSMVESISDFLPSPRQIRERQPYLNTIRDRLKRNKPRARFSQSEFREFIAQLNRLEANIYELGQMAFTGGQDKVDAKCKQLVGDPDDSTSTDYILELVKRMEQNEPQARAGLQQFQKEYFIPLKEMVWNLANPQPIRLADLPHNIRRRFINDRGDQFLVTIYPTDKVWDFEFLQRFSEQMKRVDEHITGMPPIFLSLVHYTVRDGAVATGLAILMVFVLLLADFKKVKWALMAMIPLVLGSVWMLGLLKTLGLKLTFVNVEAIPMIVGIGIDDGVHLVHRYRIEGWKKSRLVLQSTGRAILLTTLTTIAGFGSLMIAQYRGFISLGALLVLGLAACFLTTVIFLPALAGLRNGVDG